MNAHRIAFIGAGNMAQALIGGLIAGGSDPAGLAAADPSAEQREDVAQRFEIRTEADNAAACRDADVVVLAVKPQVIDPVLDELKGRLDAGTLVISVAAGIPVSRIRAALGGEQPVIRAMPNTPALFGAGVTGLLPGPGVSDEQRQLAGLVFAAAGEVVWIDDEALMDVVTAVSGSGPAYFFALTEALAKAGEAAGLESGAARRLAVRTAVGAGAMLAESGHDAAELRRRVTSPGGTTEAALEQLAAEDFDALIRRVVDAAVRRGRELGAD